MNNPGVIPRFEKPFIAVYGFAAISVFLSTLYFVCLAYHQGPFRDMWIAMDFIRLSVGGDFHLSDFFALHGGSHRLAVPRLLFLMEYQWFSGSNIFLMLVAFAAQLSVVVLIWRLLKQEQHISNSGRWFMVAICLILMFNATQLENFIYTFDVQWFITSAAAVWALVFWNYFFQSISESKVGALKKVKVKTLLLALIATFISMFSSFSGLCLWLVLPVLAMTYRIGHRNIFILVVAVIVSVVLYMQGPFAAGGNWTTPAVVTAGMVFRFLFSLIVLWLQWIALYFGSPLSRCSFVCGAIVAYSSLFFLLWQWLKLFRSGTVDRTSFQIMMLSIALWAAIVGVATGLGRMYFVHTAPEDRYQSIVLIYWLGIFGFALSRALQIEIQNKTSRFKCFAVLLIIFWTCLVLPVASIKDAHAQVSFFDRVKDADLAIATGQWDYNEIKDTLILGDKWKKINRPEMHADFLREKHWGVFASHESALLGSSLDQSLISADRCEGSIDSITAVSAPYQGYRIVGQGQDAQRETLLKSYVAIDEVGRVVGLGRLQRQKDSLRPITWQPLESAHWLLYTVDLHEQRDLKVLGELDDGGYCVMASAKLPSPHA